MKANRGYLATVLCGGLIATLCACTLLKRQAYHDFSISTPLAPDHVLVLGIVGGVERWNDDSRGVPKLAARLRALRLPRVSVETVENHRLELAVRLVRNAFDHDGDGRLDAGERQSSRLILFGHSMGAAAVVALAGKLNQMGMPVMLSVQIDSFGRDDRWIPPNVRRAVNFFQRNGLLIKGEAAIAAMDRSVTQIIGNFEFDYSGSPVDMSSQKFIRRLFNTPHDQMAADPQVWSRVEDLILAQLDDANTGG